ncbi:MAG: 3-phosphoshikimate 1-carboxyvinyltransferase [Sporanaerobacter sp.]|jgi:3-phosphoshikimate 1-carboxyvinyltransferase|uniref:3-phosphoshikimate 1-carboxyvinyltransferase n=1 Tax=Sporanaerobacter sp. TaxID=2010183 RepID=UPI003A101467
MLKGEIRVPGDKSISHRSIMLGAIAEGKTEIKNFLVSEDTLATIECFRKMGVHIDMKEDNVLIEGVGKSGLKSPEGILYCGNSGTTMRLISGILIGQDFPSILVGDSSLNGRPMKRIIFPLRQMNGNIKGVEDEYPPIEIYPSEKLNGIYYKMPIDSAQVKSAILLASIYAQGETCIEEKGFSRDHTERMLKYFGAYICKIDKLIYMKDNAKLKGKNLFVPGDISSAAFFIVGALTLKGSDILIRDVGINKSRIGILEALKEMGGDIEIQNKRIANYEPIGDIRVRYSKLKGIDINGSRISTLIDEIPILAVAAALAEGTTTIRDAEELKYKESNRLNAMAVELNKMGAKVEELEDGLVIEGVSSLKPATLNSYNDHRIAMALNIAALNADGKSHIQQSECVTVSFPSFFDKLYKLLI